MTPLEQEWTDTYCPSCRGGGWIDIGDCENGVIDNCPQCDGKGKIEL